MPLSEEEQRLLEQMEEALAAEDPKFASTLRGTTARSRQRRAVVLSSIGFAAGVGILLGGAIMSFVPLTVAGFVVMLVAGYVGLSRSRAPHPAELPSNVHSLQDKRGRGRSSRSAEPSPFMQRMEERWRRRRDEGR